MSLVTRFLRNPLKSILNALPQDPDDSAGWGPFKLPPEHPFHRAARLHDIAFRNSATGTDRLSEQDWLLFWRFVMLARAEPDPIQRCHLAMDACRYWPLARHFGRYLWDENTKKES